MIAVDTNVLVNAHRRDATFHAAARDAIAGLAESGAQWAVAWPCLGEFYSVATGRRHYDPPSTPAEALNQIDIWLESPGLVLLGESATTWSVLRTLLSEAKLAGPRVHDARIAAICLAHGVRELWTADRDYGRFPALRVRNPLMAG